MARVPVMTIAHEARSIAAELISEHHSHLRAANIVYVFTDQKRKRCDRVRVGSAGKLSALQRFLASGLDSVQDGPDFVILLDANAWGDFTKAQRHALVDHELCHCALFVKDVEQRPVVWLRWTPDMDHPDSYVEVRWGLRGHDIEEFGEVLFRHGFWKPDAPERKVGEIVALQTRIPERVAV